MSKTVEIHPAKFLTEQIPTEITVILATRYRRAKVNVNAPITESQN